MNKQEETLADPLLPEELLLPLLEQGNSILNQPPKIKNMRMEILNILDRYFPKCLSQFLVNGY